MIAVVCSAMSVSSAGSPAWQQFFNLLAPGYKPPSAQTAWRCITALNRDIKEAAAKVLADPRHGPWFVVSDGATNKGDALQTVDALNADDQYVHLGIVYGSWVWQT